MNKQIWILMLISLIFFTGLVGAETTRSCKAQYIVAVTSIDDAEGITYPSFTGQGTMDYYAPNKAREKAKDNLVECFNSITNHEQEAAYCSEANQVYNYPFPEGFMQQATIDVCSRYPNQNTIEIEYYVIWQGDQGCVYKNRWAWGPYRIQLTCPSRY